MAQDNIPYTQGLWIISPTAWQNIRKPSNKEKTRPLQIQLKIENNEVLDISAANFWNKTLTKVNPLYELITLIIGSLDRDKYDQKSCVLYIIISLSIVILANI